MENVSIESSEPWNIGSSLDNPKVGQGMQNHFSGKARLALKLCEDFLFMLEFPINFFRSLPKALIECFVQFNVGK